MISESNWSGFHPGDTGSNPVGDAISIIKRANFKSSQDSEVRIQNKTEFEFKFNSVS